MLYKQDCLTNAVTKNMVINESLANAYYADYSEKDILYALLRKELPDTDLHLQEILPNMPQNIKDIQSATNFLLYCRKICNDFLDQTKFLSDVKSNLTKVDYAILLAKSQISNNALKFYRSFSLEQKLKIHLSQCDLDKIKPAEELMRLVLETECNIISMKRKMNQTSTNESVQALKEKYDLANIEDDKIDEFYTIFQYYDSPNQSLKKILPQINNDHKSLKDIEIESKQSVYSALIEDDVYLNIFNMFPEPIQRKICQTTYNDKEFYGWKRSVILHMLIGVELIDVVLMMQESGANSENALSIGSIVSQIFFNRLEQMAYKDDEFLNGHSTDRLIDLAATLLT